MAKNIESLAKKLGATVAGTVPDYSAGAFGMAALAETLQERLEPSVGKRPGRPSNPAWSKRPKVPMAPETEQRLEEARRSAKRWRAAGQSDAGCGTHSRTGYSQLLSVCRSS